MNLLILSLLMAFGGQTNGTCPDWQSLDCRESLDRNFIFAIPRPYFRDPYPLWRIEAQEPQIVFSGICGGDCMVAKIVPITIDSIDVPAVQEPNSNHCRPCAVEGCLSMCIMEPSFTCSDPTRSLESSVDGLKHWCHRITP